MAAETNYGEIGNFYNFSILYKFVTELVNVILHSGSVAQHNGGQVGQWPLAEEGRGGHEGLDQVW